MLFQLVLLLLLAFPGVVAASTTDDPTSWWKQGVVYQVYPRSFLDGCDPACTGTGSLRGIEKKLTYLRDELGVNIIWISPIYDSPMKDFGYDISNYTSVWPTFGNVEDVRRLVASAKKIGLRVLMDLVPNHSSDQHPWFQNSKSSKSAQKRDWYIWRRPAADGGPPNNWRSMFCFDSNCSAWQLDKVTGEYYYHQFLKEQPDLNWRNPEVVQAMHDVMRFWLRLGVSGFRVDAFINILEDPDLRNEPIDPSWHGDPVTAGYEKLIHTRTENQPGMHGIVQGMQSVLQEFGKDRMIVGEVYADQVTTEEDVMKFYGSKDKPEFNMPFNFVLVPFFGASFTSTTGSNNFRNATALRQTVDHYDSVVPSWAQPNYVLGNHDNRRVRSRVGGSEQLARSLMVLLLSLRGTPTIYNGDEMGMLDGYVPPGQRQDPPCLVNFTSGRCRDPERTPLQWTSQAPNAGFTGPDTHPWLPVSSSYKKINVETQLSNQSSFLSLTSKMLKLREESPGLNKGGYMSMSCPSLDKSNSESVFCYMRGDAKSGDALGDGSDRFLILINLGTQRVEVDASNGDVSFGEFANIEINSRDPCDRSQVQDMSKIVLEAEQSLVIRVDGNSVNMVAEISFIVLSIVTCSIVCLVLISKHRSNASANCCPCISSNEGYFKTSSENGVRLERRDAIKHCIFVAILLGSTNSFNTTIISGVAGPILNLFYGCSGSENVHFLEGLLVACILFGGFFGSLIAPSIADRLGRPDAIVVCGLVSTLFPTLLAAFAGSSFALVIIFRIFVGLSLGMSTVLGPLYISERAPEDIRGRIGTCYQVMVCSFLLMAELLNFACNPESLDDLEPSNIQFQLGVSALIGLATMVYGLIWLPDIAPRGNSQEDMVPLATERGSFGKVRMDRDGNASFSGIGLDLVVDDSFCDSLRRINFKWWILIFVLPATQQLTGINAVVLYGPKIIKSGGFKDFLLVTFLCIGLWNLLSVFVSSALIERMGRRTLMLVGLCGMALSLLGLGMVFAILPLGDPTRGISALAFIMGYLFFFEVGPGPLFFVMASESFPESIKSNAIGLANGASWIYNIMVVFLFPSLTKVFGDPEDPTEGDIMSGTATMFIVFSVVCAGCFYVVFTRVSSQ